MYTCQQIINFINNYTVWFELIPFCKSTKKIIDKKKVQKNEIADVHVQLLSVWCHYPSYTMISSITMIYNKSMWKHSYIFLLKIEVQLNCFIPINYSNNLWKLLNIRISITRFDSLCIWENSCNATINDSGSRAGKKLL